MSSPLEYTAVSEIPVRVAKLHAAFHSRKFDDVEVRLNALRNLYFCIKDNEDLIIKAIKKDLNKSPEETKMTELAPVYGDLLYTIANLRDWVKGRKPESIPFLYKFSKTKIEYTPLGTVLVIGAYNYPVLLCMQPVLGAIAAGNTVVLKQSEMAPNTTAIMTEILSDALDNELIQCIDGGIEETTAVLEEKFDMVIYTGSGIVGKIIAKKCAETLTPCILELGGKSPAFVTAKCKNLDLAAKRIVFGKFTNAGQICVAVDHCLVDQEIYEEFAMLTRKWVEKIFGSASPETYGKIVNQRNTERVANIIRETKGEIVYGGDSNISERFIQPTVIRDVSFADSTMQGEIFGPVLPLIKYSSLDDAITQVVTHHDTPLALYAFSSDKKETNLIKTRIRSGAFLMNDVLVHVGMAQLPFGGVGTSGYGNYHGYSSFRAFSHERSTLNQPFWIEPLFEAKYPPTSKIDLKIAMTAMVPPAWFGRTGKIRNWKKIFRNTAIAMLLATGLYMGFNSERDQKFFSLGS